MRTATTEESPEEELRKKVIQLSPPLLISTVVHMLLIIIMGLWMLKVHLKEPTVLTASYTPDLGQQMMDPKMSVWVDKPQMVEDGAKADFNLPVVDDPFSQPKMSVNLNGTFSAFEDAASAPHFSVALSGREAGMKKYLLGKYGGDKKSESAVDAGLAWLEKQQQKNGAWSLKGPYSSGGMFENVEAATAMALLAFQGAGNSHRTGTFQKNVAAGLKHLLRIQGRDGNFFGDGPRDDRLYTNAQCTIVLCELYAMTKDSQIRAPTELALKYCLDAQNEDGGWRYQPRFPPGDTSVTGWMAMALQSAKMAGLEVPTEAFNQLGKYLDSAATDELKSQYSYLPGDGATRLSMTAEALLCREYLGWEPTHKSLIAGAKFVSTNLPRWEERDVYYWYYATQMLHHFEGETWKQWNEVQRDMLVEHQELSGRERGSWHPLGKDPDMWADRGGRLYVTCLSLYILEVYYRHLPLYSKLKEQLDKGK